MNKNRYRLIFNPARGALIAVSELTHSRSQSTGTTTAVLPGTTPRGLVAVLRREVYAVLMALGMVTLLNQPTFAQIVAGPAAPGNQQPMIVPAANGVPLVNIQTPSAAGVSRNVYSQFDVGSAGVIFNNAVTNTATQLGGWIQGNPYLAGGSARVILNEVNSINPSQLLGYIEVGGSRAQVVIANPAGITCNGCGFINASRATLTTGTPILNGGNLDGYRVQQGAINVSGAGLDGRQVDYTDLIARAVVVNAGIWAQQLGVTAGANQVDAAHTLATPIVGSGAAPAVSIDVAALGGMYAGKITLVSTGAGVGVANAGQISASAGDVRVTADGRLQNSGRISSAADIRTVTGGLTNSGMLHALGNAALTSETDIDNTGVIAAAADLALNANSINNQSALLNAGGTLIIQTNTLDNRDTQGLSQGIQANSVLVNANLVNNTLGTMSANNNLTFISVGSLNNTQGQITAGQTLTLADAGLSAKTLAITNTQGTLLAGQNLQVNAASLSGDGSLRSPGDISISLASNFTHTGEIIATGNAVFATRGILVNQAQIQAGNALTVSAANIDNTASGEFNATATTLTATGLLTNRGLIDGIDTFLTAGTLDNLGSGRIYGDHLAIAAVTLNNLAEHGAAPVIAARTRLDLGVGTLSNQNNALIFSAGDMAIGGALDANRQAAGQAALVLNNGAVMEALGSLTINALDLQNRNAHLLTQQIVDPSSFQQSVQPRGSSIAYDIATCWGIGGGQDKNGCAGYPATFEDYTWLRVTATPSHTEVLATQPGQILAGGDLLLAGGSVTNQDSHLIAGGLLDYSGSTLTNFATQGQDITTYNGTAQYTHVKSCGTFGNKHCRKWGGVAAYNPAPTYGTPYDLPTTQLAAHTAPIGSGTMLAAATGPAAIGAPAPVTLPNNALFQPSPNPTAGYLIETDPRFANYRTWLSSDYMLGQLGMDPAYRQKRLGDGFYEQRLVREQVAQLTGRRFLDGYANDEVQYQALMNAGVSYAGEWNLIPGVALTAVQMAALTSDIVWLVTTEATLPDGTTQSVLSPQVYVRVQPGDLDGSGSLLSGATVNLRLAGGVLNSGSVVGRNLVNLAADNLHNLGGRISGHDVAVAARQDINNTGGSIAAVDSLVASAGRDLNVETTTRASASEGGQGSFTRTGIERVAGLYVSGPAGLLIASAGRDLTLTAAQITNSGAVFNSGGADAASGRTLIDAGNNLTLATVTTAEQNSIVWDAKNHLKQGSTQDIGTTIHTQGDLTLQAGNDLGARAATVTSAGAIRVGAGHDLSIESGEASQNWGEARHSSKRGTFSSKTSTRVDRLAATQSLASTFSGDSVNLTAGHDLTVKGSTVTAEQDLAVMTGNAITLTSAANTRDTSHFSDTQKSGWSKKGREKRSAQETLTERAITHTGSSLLSETGNITVAANLNPIADPYQGVVQVDGSTIRAETGTVAISGKHLLVTASEDQSESERTLKESKSTWAFNTGLPTGQKHALDAASQQSTKNASTIAGGKGVSLTAPGVIDLTAAHLSASDGDIRIQGGAVSLQSGQNQRNAELQETYKKTGVDFKDLTGTFKPGEGVGFKSKLTKENARTTLAPTTLDAQNISIQSTAGDVTLAAVEANAPGTITLVAADTLNLASTTTTAYQSTDLKKKDLAWQSVKGGGTLDETTQYNQLNAAQINLAAGSRITADMGVKDSVAVLAQTPGMEWLKQLDDPALAGKIDWQSIEETHKKWDYQQQGLTPAAAVVIAIVVAFFTAGAGTAALGTTTATAAGGTTTALAGTTLATTTAATATAAAVTTYTTAGVVLNAAVTTLASQAAVSLINNGGDLGQTLKDLGSKESLKQLATSIVTAGVLNEVGQFNFGSAEKPFTLNSINVNHGFIANAGKNLVTGLARATINSALTGTDLETLLKTEAIASLLNAASAQGAKWVGDQAMEGGFFINDAGKVNEFGRAFAHAVVGCMAGAAGASASGSNTSTGSGCGAGALGAVVGEFSAQLYGAADPAKTIAFASMMSGIAAAAAGQGPEGVAIAAGTGANAAQNNFLSHQLQAKREKLRNKVDKGTASGNERTELLMLERADQVSDELIAKWRANPHSLSTRETQALASYVGVYAQQEGEAKALQLMGPQALFTGAFSNYGFPYAGTKAAQDAYLAAHPLSWKELFLKAGSNYDNPNRDTYKKAISQSIVANQHQAQAELGNTILLGSSKTLMLAASAFELGKGGAALVDGEYATGIMHMGLGLLGMTGAYALGRPVTPVAGVSATSVVPEVIGSTKTTGRFETQGLNRDSTTFPDGVKLIQELEKTGLSQAEAVRQADRLILTGNTLPVARPIDITDRLYKVVPAGTTPSQATPYWVTETELSALKQNPALIAERLGLPPSQFNTNAFDVYVIRPNNGAVVFESKVAETTLNGVKFGQGGATQTLVPNRALFTPPAKVDSIKVR